MWETQPEDWAPTLPGPPLRFAEGREKRKPAAGRLYAGSLADAGGTVWHRVTGFLPKTATNCMSGLASKTILVVDDETFMHVFMQHHLARAGYQVLAARNGREGLEKAANEKPDLIVMDVMMAEMDGLSALRQLKQTETTRGIPVIMITTSAQALTRQESEASGAALFMTKPFSPTQLLLEIKRLLGE